MTRQTTSGARPALSTFWTDLPTSGRWLLSTVAVETFGTGLILPFGFIYLHEVRQISTQSAGTLLAIPAVVGLCVVGPAGRLTDRLGARKVIISGMVAQLVGNLILAAATTALMAALAFCFVGAAVGIFWPAFNAMIGNVVPSAIRQRYFGINFTMVNLGIGVGGVVSGVFVDVHRPWTFTALYLANAASFIPSLLVMLGPLRHVSGRAEAHEGARGDAGRTSSYLDIIRADKALRPVLALTFVSAFVGYGQIEAGFTAYARLVGEVSTRTIGLAFAANTVTIVALQLVVLQRIEGRRRTRVLLVMCALWGISWLLLGLSGAAPGTLLASGFVIGGFTVFALGETLLQPTAPAITNDLSPDHLRGRYNAVASAFFQLAAILAPGIAGLMIGAHWDVGYIAMLLGGCAVMAWISMRVERAIPLSANGINDIATARS